MSRFLWFTVYMDMTAAATS